MYFRSKRDVLITVVIWIALICGMLMAAAAVRYIPGFFPALYPLVLLSNFISICMLTLIVWAWLKTEYQIVDDAQLAIQSGPLKFSIEIKEIMSIRKLRNKMTSPALSFDRLEITMREQSVMISPEDRDLFVASLLKINKNITLLD